VVGPAGIEERVLALMELAYPSFLRKAAFGLCCVEIAPGKDVSAAGLFLSAAGTDHSAPCLAVRVEAAGRSLFYSGDGRPTPETLDLARGCDLVAHEAFSLDPDTPGHGTVDGAIAFARAAKAGSLALVHLQRDLRRTRLAEVQARLAAARDVNAFLPEPGFVWPA
jgi:ribonuclease BN (tRNA processing enzyme)